MIASSMGGHSRDAFPFGRFPVLKWDPNNPNVPMAKIYRGGSPIPDRATISDLDIERVEQLYPIMMQGTWGFGPPEPPLDVGLEGQPRMRSRDNAISNAMQPPYRAVVSDVVTTTIRPAPTDFPADFDDPEANEQFIQYAKACNVSDFCDEPQEIPLILLEYPQKS